MLTKSINISDFKRNFYSYVRKPLKNVRYIIFRYKKPILEIKPIDINSSHDL